MCPYDESVYDDFGKQPNVLEIQLGKELLSITNEEKEDNLQKELKTCKNQLDTEYGLPLPPVQIKDNCSLKSNEYKILLHGNEVGHFEGLLPNQYMCLDINGVREVMTGNFIHIKDPAFNLNGFIIDEFLKEVAEDKGYICLSLQKTIKVHLFEIIKKHITSLLTQSMVNTLINKVRPSNPDVVDNVFFENDFKVSSMKKILNLLLEEEVSIRDMNTIIETIADNLDENKTPLFLVEKVRQKLANNIFSKLADKDNTVHVIILSNKVITSLGDKIEISDDGIHEYFDLDPVFRKELINKMSQNVEEIMSKGYEPVFLCTSNLRKPFAEFIPFNTLKCISDLECYAARKIYNIKIEGELL